MSQLEPVQEDGGFVNNIDSAPPGSVPSQGVSPNRLTGSRNQYQTSPQASRSGTSPLPRSILGASVADTDDSENQLKGGTNKNISNHYEVPNLSSMLYEFTNNEQDRIHQSFRVGNFQSLRDLPRHLLPGNVSDYSRSKIQSNLYRQVEERSYVELQNGGGYFSKFAWQPDEYANFLEK